MKTLKDVLANEMKDPRFKESFEHYRSCFEIGLKVRKLRKAAGFTQKQLAESLGVKQQVISSLERGDSVNPTLSTLEKIANVTGRKLDISFV